MKLRHVLRRPGDEQSMLLPYIIRGTFVALMSALVATSAGAGETRIGIAEGKWQLNGQVTYPGTRAEGLLMNVRMINAVYEDTRRPEFDPQANTDAFIQKIPDYVAHGVRAFTVGLQGGFPGYEGAVNSAFNPDGSLRDSYMARLRQVIEACDNSGAAVILSCFYQRQDQILADETAIRAALVNATKWVTDQGFTNVVLEIANEFGHRGFDHDLIQTVEGQLELHKLVRQTAPQLLVGTSGQGRGRYPAPLAKESDLLLIHFNNTPLEAILERIEALREFGKPIICNEDTKVGQEGARAAELCVEHGASWGLMLEKHNQHFPFHFDGAADDPAVYEKIRELTSPPSSGEGQ
jgi:hypothetical protein